MADKKPVKKVAKAAPKAASKAPVKTVAATQAASKAAPVKKSAPAKKAAPATKNVAAKKPEPAKKVPVKTVAPAKKAVSADKSAPAKKVAPASKTAAVKKEAPVKTVASTPKPASAAAAKPASTSKSAKSGKSGKSSKQPEPKPVVISSAQNVPRKPGKVAVAQVAKPSAPVPKGKFKVVPYRTDPTSGRPIVPSGYKPGADEEYMSVLQLEYFRKSLLDWRGDLVEESKQTIENLKEEVRDVGDEAERATRETENSLELRTRDRYRKLIGKIDSTLKRLDEGDYGYCVESGEEIGLDRLHARLTAERTIDAQERWEHIQKQMGE